MLGTMDYRKAQIISMKGHAAYSEKWLQERIAEDPSILGLGDLVVRDVERRQPRAGRLDLLLSDPDQGIRYEVEIQLGSTDEAHIIRTIEYWDIEKSRYPQFEHVAVIVAEDITSRFLNVISLFNKAIPLIAIQMQAIAVGQDMTLHAVKVLDLMTLGVEEEDDDAGQVMDRKFWDDRAGKPSLTLTDLLLQLVNEVHPGHELKYNKHYVGLSRSGVVDNFVAFRPRREHVVVEFRIPRSDELTGRIEQSGLDVLEYSTRWRRYRVRVSKADLAKHRDLLLALIAIAAGVPVPSTANAD
jgi:hypothetical protein